MTNKHSQKPLEFQTWICPKCYDDHSQNSECSPLENTDFMPHESDHSHIADKYRELYCAFLAEQAKVKELEAKLLTNESQFVSTLNETLEIVKQLDQEIERLRSALEFECGNRCARGINPCNARQILDELADLEREE
jgi:hypothetical protein